MLQFVWNKILIETKQQAKEILDNIQMQDMSKNTAAFDTETTGLHIILDKPFLFQFGYVDISSKIGYAFIVDLMKHWSVAKYVIPRWHKCAKTFLKYIGANVKFDLHMLQNINMPYDGNNISDLEFLIHYATDAKHVEEGGAPLGLKKCATMYIDAHAKDPEHLLKHEQAAIAKVYNVKLKEMLKNCGAPPNTYNAKSYTLGVISEIFKDKTFEIDDLWEPVKTVYKKWLRTIPKAIQDKMTEALVTTDDIPYYSVNRDTLVHYAFYDIIYTLELWFKFLSTLKARHNEIGMQFEEDTIYPLVRMERTGFLADKEYLEESRIKLKTYLLKCRKELAEKAGQPFKVGQHALIKDLLKTKFKLEVSKTSNSELDLIINSLKRHKTNNEVLEFIEMLQELRTLEKWYSVYIIRFQNDLKHCDRLYTQIHQVGTVSGRVTSDFQQFPKKAITTRTGEVLFHPRRIIKAEQGLVYLDYSQIELRFQALYTILVGNPDLNLCRAYMPYKCISDTGVPFDYKNPEHIKNWNKEWYYEEEPTKRWVPTDVHGATTTAATGLTPDDPEYKIARSTIGKRTNFAKNYGAQYKKICEMFPDKTPEECRKIDQAYYTAFPGVKKYHNYCYELANVSSYATNLFDVKYYGASGHKLINLLVQGSAAYYLKTKIKEIDNYLQTNNYKTKIQMQIHDELSFIYNPEDPIEIFFEIKNIMQTWKDTLVPIVADMEVTKTYWSEKQDVGNLEELRLYFSS